MWQHSKGYVIDGRKKKLFKISSYDMRSNI